MREIKFRAWDKETNTMSQPRSIQDLCIMKDTIADFAIMDEMLEFIQYTGLKDKNGVEIYEGDWIETPAGIGDVAWDKCYYIRWNPNDMTTLHDCQQSHLKVIGNIYENKELLEVRDADRK